MSISMLFLLLGGLGMFLYGMKMMSDGLENIAGGKLAVMALVENGRISDIRFFGDFFASEDIKELELSLKGCRYEEAEIKNALQKAHAGDCFYSITPEEILSCII